MNAHLKQLIEISHLDKDIEALEPQIQAKRTDLDKALAQRQKQQAEYSALEEEKGGLKLQINKNEQTLHEINAKIDSIQKKIAQIKSERELRSLSIEEDITKERANQANKEIERLENEIAHKNRLQEKLKEDLEKLAEQISALEQRVEEDTATIKAQQQEIFQNKQNLVLKMDRKLIAFYERIRRWAGNTCVVHVRKQACGGCFIRINDKTYAEILRSQDILTCPHCGRILYANREVSANSQ
ncbi:zinc ribbon domain-containing protein [Helicobacter cynogastricus]|uniref:zinc ribbon domain-containing protein n=1 Tax=Helicobacter cynogastricus TaxID=329937 RepID=UPI000CF1A54F|nr:zinc ribbon domain-containing protein [Helicobacter cynogastricus]